MNRILLVSLLGGLAAPVALAQEAKPQACIVKSTETVTAPKKPNLFAMELDCGLEPDPAQQAAAILVNNSGNTADALKVMLELGYELEGMSTINSYVGNAIVSHFAFVKEVEVEAAAEPTPEDDGMGDGLEDAEDEMEGMDDLPEAGSEAPEGAEEGAEEASEE